MQNFSYLKNKNHSSVGHFCHNFKFCGKSIEHLVAEEPSSVQAMHPHPHPHHPSKLFLCMWLLGSNPSVGSRTDSREHKAISSSHTWQFSSPMPLSEWDDEVLSEEVLGQDFKGMCQVQIWDGAGRDPKPRRGFLGLSLLLFGIQAQVGTSGQLPGSKNLRKFCPFISQCASEEFPKIVHGGQFQRMSLWNNRKG